MIEQQRMPSNCQGRGPTFGPRNCPRTRGYQCFDCEAESSAKALNLHVCAGTLRYTVGQHVRFDGTYCPRHEVEIGEIVGRVVGFEGRSKLEEDGQSDPSSSSSTSALRRSGAAAASANWYAHKRN